MSRVLEFPGQQREQEQAAAWIVRLDRGLRGVEREQLSQWVAESPRNRQALLAAAGLWDRMGVLAEIAEQFPLREETCNVRTGRASQVAALALISLVGAMAAVFAIRPHGTRVAAESSAVGVAPILLAADPVRTASNTQSFAASYSTAIGEQRSINLPDHSTIQLNTNTALQVEFTATVRLIRMTRGEANFQVAKNPARIFTVRVAGFDFNAVGTAFNIRADSPQVVRLTVTEGRVRVNRSQAQVSGPGLKGFTEVEANKEVIIGQSSARIAALEQSQVAAATAWQRGMIMFNATPLEQVVSEFGRYSTTRFVIGDPALGKIPVSGYFRLGDVDALATALEHNFGISVRKGDDQILLSTHSPK